MVNVSNMFTSAPPQCRPCHDRNIPAQQNSNSIKHPSRPLTDSIAEAARAPR